MYQNHRIAKQLTLNLLNELVRVLKYKTEWKNKRFKNKELKQNGKETMNIQNVIMN